VTAPTHPGRRAVLRLAALSVGLPWARRAAADDDPAAAAPRALAFRNLHTGETVDVVYRADGQLDRAAVREIDWVLRDFRAGEARSMDQRLLDLGACAPPSARPRRTR
jgi:uncharacterized protein YcbK (DUF882 family)